MATKQKKLALPPGGQSKQIGIEKLRLDPLNPRLPESVRKRSQPELVKILAEDYSLLEIGRSLADNGFFSEEPLAAIAADPPSKGEYIVVEGNRRLAALKLLTDAQFRARVEGDEWEELSKELKFELSEVPVITYGQRSDLLNFMGFRHITGVKAWEPLAKARFVHSLIDKHHMTFSEAARRIGSRPSAVRQQYLIYRVYLQARDEFELDVSKVESSYGIFTRALASSDLKQHIGISPGKNSSDDAKSLARPIPTAKKRNLEEFVSWVVGTESAGPVIGESRGLTELGEVVASPEALQLLRVSRDLNSAKLLTGGEQTRLLQHLAKASYSLDEALKDIHRHKDSALVQSAVRRCSDSVAALNRTLDS